MEARTFNTIMPSINHRWLARILGMRVAENEHVGPDLIDDDKVVEVKFKLTKPPGYTHICWTVYETQARYSNGRNAYWALGTYTLDRRVRNLRLSDVPDLEKMVKRREVWIVNWDWIYGFKSHPNKGPKESTWDDQGRRYPKGRDIPRIEHTYKVMKGLLHITEKVDPRIFDIRGKKI